MAGSDDTARASHQIETRIPPAFLNGQLFYIQVARAPVTQAVCIVMNAVRLLISVLLLSNSIPVFAAAKDADARPARIKFSTGRGVQSSPFDLRLSTDAAGAQIFFTTNGLLPLPQTGRQWTNAVPIATTTILRAAGYLDGKLVTEVDTHTFLFLADVLNQTGGGTPATWGTNNGQAVRADYEMDPEIVRHPSYRDELPKALNALLSLSIVLDPDDLYDPARGIYSNPKEAGDEWERAASMEWLHADGAKNFKIDCGLRIQGGWNRRPEESPKHAFRLAFRKKYGAGKLKAEIFQRPGTDEFQGLVLRAGCNNSWLHWSGTERKQGDHLRDQWMRDTYAAMGHPSARGAFVHLYLNGIYWGVYNVTERPDEHFAAGHLGGKLKNIDARNADKILSGDDLAWKQLFTLANAGLRDEVAYAAMGQQLDLDAFIDFMILNLYGANGDWDRASNWYAARRRSPAGPFVFFVWDGERTLEDVQASVLKFDDDFSPPRLFHKLRENEAFRARFAERVRKHLSGDGVLTGKLAAGRFRQLADQLEQAIVAESARWGDYRRDVHSYKTGPYEIYTRDAHWRPEIQRLLNRYFPKRPDVFLKQLSDAGLYPQ